MKQKIFIAGSALISLVVNLFGGWDTALETLILFMGIDWFTGGVLLPVVFKKESEIKKRDIGKQSRVERIMQKRDGVVICIDCSKTGSADGDKLSEGYGVYCIYSK